MAPTCTSAVSRCSFSVSRAIGLDCWTVCSLWSSSPLLSSAQSVGSIFQRPPILSACAIHWRVGAFLARRWSAATLRFAMNLLSPCLFLFVLQLFCPFCSLFLRLSLSRSRVLTGRSLRWQGMMPSINAMLERVAAAKGVAWDARLAELKKRGQWHVEVY
ncbi:unnamed protein product [Phaeothamnion confervicola]